MNKSIPGTVPPHCLWKRSACMGRMAPSCTIHTQLMAVQHNQENTIRVNLGIYPKHSSAKQDNVGTRDCRKTKQNQRTPTSSTACTRTSTTTSNKRNEVQTIQRRRQSLVGRNTFEATI